MDIVSRIKRFLEQENFTVSQFADTCTIPRPTVSQLLNGRNKKVSDEIISKIHVAYPYLSISWLLFGEGEMCVANLSNDPNLSDDTLCENQIFRMNSRVGLNNSNVDELNAENISYNSPLSCCESEYKGSASSGHNGGAENVQKINSGISGMQQMVNSDRKVVNIIVYYSDNSFEQFVPASRK